MVTTFELQFVTADPDATFTWYGGAKDFANYRGAEAIVHGPAETGKSISALWLLHTCAMKYPGSSLVVMRKTLTSTYSTILQTFKNKVLGADESRWPCVAYGGEKPEWFNYYNGSRIWIAGMDKSSRVLSSEHDIVFWNQVEEATLEEWEVCTTRTTGRAGNMPYAQTIGDCNPAYPSHWIYNRESLRLFYSRHEENPALFDQETGEITEQITTPFEERAAALDSTGKWLAFDSNRSGKTEVYLTTLEPGPLLLPVSKGGGHDPRWSADGRTLYYVQIFEDELWAVDVEFEPGIKSVGSTGCCGPARLFD